MMEESSDAGSIPASSITTKFSKDKIRFKTDFAGVLAFLVRKLGQIEDF